MRVHQKRTDTTCGNSLVGQWELERRQKKHREALSQSKSTLNLKTPPAPQPHLTLYGRDYAVKKKATTEAAFADLKMIQAIARTMTRPVKVPERHGPQSLNTEARKADITRIVTENRRLLGAIETAKPFEHVDRLVSDHNQQQRYVINASHSKRLYREYDDQIKFIKADNTAKHAEQKRSTDKRIQLGLARRSPGSVSLPSLMPADHGRMSPQPATKMMGSSSSSSAGAGKLSGSAPAASTSQSWREESRTSLVHFEAYAEQEDSPHPKQPKTPHPKGGYRMPSKEELEEEELLVAEGALLTAEELVEPSEPSGQASSSPSGEADGVVVSTNEAEAAVGDDEVDEDAEEQAEASLAKARTALANAFEVDDNGAGDSQGAAAADKGPVGATHAVATALAPEEVAEAPAKQEDSVGPGETNQEYDEDDDFVEDSGDTALADAMGALAS